MSYNYIYGTQEAETLTGTDGNDAIYAYGGDDLIIGLGGKNILSAGAGDDTIDGSGSSSLSGKFEGGLGADVIIGSGKFWTFAYYNNSTEGIHIDLNTGVGKGGEAEGDTFIDVRGIYGSQYDDLIIGKLDAGNNLIGGNGNDTLIGGDSGGTDELRGGYGADVIDGGAGGISNRASYEGSGEGVHVSLITNTGKFGSAEGDVLINIYDIEGSTKNDTFEGSHSADNIYGGRGDDLIMANGGNDLLSGGLGFDTIYGGEGCDVINGYKGNDVLNGGTSNNIIDDAIDTANYWGANSEDFHLVVSGGDSLGSPKVTTITNIGGIHGTDTLINIDVIKFTDKTIVFDGAHWYEGTGACGAGITITGDIIIDGEDIPVELSPLFTDIDDVVDLNTISQADYISGTQTTNALKGNDNIILSDSDNWAYISGVKFHGGQGHDIVTGGTQDDVIYGDRGSDTISGGAGNDTIKGAYGNDVIDGGAGTDVGLYLGNLENYTITVDGAKTTIVDNTGLGGVDIVSNIETLKFADCTLTWNGSGWDNDCKDDEANEGGGLFTPEVDIVNLNTVIESDYEAGIQTTNALAGDDNVILSNHNNWAYIAGKAFYANEGDDIITGGIKSDLIYGDDGQDTLIGGNGKDTLYGGNGNDKIEGGNGKDIIKGGNGNDNIHGGLDNGSDTLVGGGGDDILNGGNGRDTAIYGSMHNYTITLSNGVTIVTDKTGADGVDVLTNIEVLKFHDSTMTFVNGNWTDGKGGIVDGTDANDLMEGDEEENEFHAGHGDDELKGGGGNDKLKGEGGDDDLRGNQGEDELRGGDGNDRVLGGKGNDYVNGNKGADTINGNNGNDRVLGGKGDDIAHGGKEDDFINGNNSNDAVYGDSGNDTVHGGKGDDVVYGGDGSDYLYGGLGNDTLYGGKGDDIFVFNKIGLGTDIIKDFEIGIDKLHISSEIYAASIDVVEAFSGGVLGLGDGSSVELVGVVSLGEGDIVII